MLLPEQKPVLLSDFFYALSMNFYMYSSREVNYQNIVIDVAITIVMSAAVGAVIALVNDKLK